MAASLRLKAALLSELLLLAMLGVWELTKPEVGGSAEMIEYELLMGGADQEARVPPPSAVASKAWEELSNPFYDAGPNDKGIGIQIGYSLYRVLSGYFLAALIAILLMSNGPDAKVAESVVVDIPRPRRRADIIHEPGYYEIRNHLVDFLTHIGDEDRVNERNDSDQSRPMTVRPGLAAL